MPWLLAILILANIVTFFWEVSLGEQLHLVASDWGVIPVYWLAQTGADFLEWPHLSLSLFTFQFLHAGWLHLLSNLVFAWVFGADLERAIGFWRFAILYVISGLVAGVAYIVLVPNSAVPLVGASGAVAGLLGAHVLLFPFTPLSLWYPTRRGWRKKTLKAMQWVGLWFVLQWIPGITSIGLFMQSGGITFATHMMGFIAGMVAAVMVYPSHGLKVKPPTV